VTKRSKRTARVVQNDTWRDIAGKAVFAWFVQNVLDTVLTNRPFTQWWKWFQSIQIQLN